MKDFWPVSTYYRITKVFPFEKPGLTWSNCGKAGQLNRK